MVEMLITSLGGLEEHENRAANIEALVHGQKVRKKMRKKKTKNSQL